MAASAPSLPEQLLKSIEQNRIPPCPAILQQVVAETRKTEPDLRALAVIISADAGVAASLLKTVNSPFYGLPNKAHTVQQAISLLGIRATANAVASITLQRALPTPPQLERFWDSSMKIARLSGWLAQQLQARVNIAADLAYTFSLFRDAGIPIMLSRFPDYHATLQEANTCPLRGFTEIEEERHSTSHALIGYLLTQSWWLASDTCKAVRHHHDCTLIATDNRVLSVESGNLIMLAQLAEYLLQQTSGQCHTREWDKMGEAICTRLGLNDTALQELLEQARDLPLGDD